MKKLKFTSDLINKILSGEKTSTWRLFDDKNLQRDDELIFIENNTEKEFAKAIITSVYEKKFKDLTDEDFKGHKRYMSEEEMYKAFKNYYNLDVTPASVLKVVYFRLK